MVRVEEFALKPPKEAPRATASFRTALLAMANLRAALLPKITRKIK